MPIDIDRLNSLPREELVQLAHESGIRVHHKAKAETIVKQIVDKVFAPAPLVAKEQSMEHVAAKPTASVYHNTPEDVELALDALKKNERFQSRYDLTENTWHFSWVSASGRTMREECGNLDIPLRVIKMKAQSIAKGPLLLRSKQDFSVITDPNRPDAYTNTVM